MARLIDAEELKKYIEDVRIRLLGHLVGKNLVADAMNEALSLIPQAIDEQPTVVVVEVVHGEWEQLCDPYFSKTIPTISRCTACGKKYNLPNISYNYCPNCGAKMDGEET